VIKLTLTTLIASWKDFLAQPISHDRVQLSKLERKKSYKRLKKMGQEASLPQDGEDFDEQARAPPSSVNPPSTNHHHTGGRPGSKMIGTMLQRAGAAAHHQQDYESKEAAMAAADSGQLPFQNNGSDYGMQTQHLQQLQQSAQYSSHPTNFHQWTPEEQQTYHHQQQLAMQQQQMMQNQQPQHYAQQSASANASSPTGVVYGAPSGKKGGRGKALINSMRNLSIGQSIRSGVQATAHVAAATANAAVSTAAAVNATVKSHSNRGGAAEWETRWDEDDDDSDGEEDEIDSKPSAVNLAALPIPHHYQQQQQPPDHTSTQIPGTGAIQTHPPLSATPHSRANVVTPVKAAPLRAGDRQISDDALEWDTGAQQDITSKPNIEMFMPLLRVLGKGSFGKVSSAVAFVFTGSAKRIKLVSHFSVFFVYRLFWFKSDLEKSGGLCLQ